MKKRSSILLVVVIAVAILFAIWMTQQKATPETKEAGLTSSIVSDDGKLTLIIPTDALPDGMSATDISITAINDNEIGASYSLQPDGMQFKSPIKLEYQLPEPGQNDSGQTTYPISAAFLISDDGQEFSPMQNVEITTGPEEGKLTAELNHFTIAVFRHFWQAAISEPGNVLINRPFTIFSSLSQVNDEQEIPVQGMPGVAGFVQVPSEWYVEFGEFYPDSMSEIVMPLVISNKPGEPTGPNVNLEPPTALFDGEFVCSQVSSGHSIGYYFNMSYQLIRVVVDESDEPIESVYYGSFEDLRYIDAEVDVALHSHSFDCSDEENFVEVNPGGIIIDENDSIQILPFEAAE